MDVKCPHCGTAYEAGKRELYKYTKCSVCGKGFVVGATTSLQRDSTCIEPTSAAQPEAAPQPDKEPRQRPKLSPRRPATAVAGGTDVGGAAVAAVEARYEEQRRKERIKKIKRLAGNAFSMLLLVVLVFIGYKAWRTFRGKGFDNFGDAIMSIGGSVNSPADDMKPSEDEPKQAQRNHLGEIEDKVETIVSEKEMFNILSNEIKASRLSFWRELDKSKRPGVIDGRFVAMISKGKKTFRLYEILSSQGGITNIMDFAEGADGVLIALPDFEKLLNANGGFVFADGAAYAFRQKTTRKYFQAPQNGDKFDPAREYLGTLVDIASERGIKTDGVSYKVSFAFSDGDEPVEVATVDHGKSVPYEEFRKVAMSIAKDIQRKSLPKPKQKKFTPTVVFYDGHLVAKGIRLTKVPRSYPVNSGTSYNEWVRLRDEAIRQEGKAQQISLENKRRDDEWRRGVDGPPDSALVQKVLYSGKVLITATSNSQVGRVK